MAGSLTRKHLNKNYEIIGVFTSYTAYLADLNKSSAEEGMCFYNTTSNRLETFDGSNWSPAGMGGQTAGSLDDAANIGDTITLDYSTSGVLITATHNYVSTDGALLYLKNRDSGSDVHSLEVSNSGTAPMIILHNRVTTTDDIRGTGDNWAITGAGIADLTRVRLDDAQQIMLGTDQDVTIDFNDGAIGTKDQGLIFSSSADEKIQFGNSSFSFDIWFVGDTSCNNRVTWDLDGGIDSVGALIFDKVDLEIGDSDVLTIGDGYDLMISSDGTDISFTTSTDNTVLNIGDGTKDFDIKWFGGTAGKHIIFDASGADVDITDCDVGFGDASVLQFGNADDITYIYTGSTSTLNIDGPAANVMIKIGATSNIDWYIYGDAATDYVYFDTSAEKMIFENFDLRFNDDDYLLLGNSAAGGSTADATLRWDANNSELEVIGATRFEQAVVFDGAVTISGTLTHTGAFAPGGLDLDDDENFTWGDGIDYRMYTSGSTNPLIITAVNANDAIQIGDGSVATDFIIQNVGVSGADIHWDDSLNILKFGASDTGIDVRFYGDTNNYDILWDCSDNALEIQDYVKLTVGTSGIVLLSSGANGLSFQQANSDVGEMRYGIDGTGIDQTWYSNTGGDYLKWDEDVECLEFVTGVHACFDDNCECRFGEGSTFAGDFKIYCDATNLHIKEVSATGKILFLGESDKGLDVHFYGETATSDMLWDQSANALLFEDDTYLMVGASTTSPDLKIHSDGTTAVITMATGLHIGGLNKTLQLGISGSNGTDVRFESASGTANATWDAGAQTLFISDNAEFGFGGSVGTEDILFHTDGTTAVITMATGLHIGGLGKTLQLGISGSNGTDVKFESASGTANVTWDAGVQTMIFGDNTALGIGATAGTPDMEIISDGTSTGIILATNSVIQGENKTLTFGICGTHGTDIIFESASGTSTAKWDAGAASLAMADGTVTYTFVQLSNNLLLSANSHANSKFQVGTTTANGLDFKWQGSASNANLVCDAANGTLTVGSGANLVIVARTDQKGLQIPTLAGSPGVTGCIGAIMFDTTNKKLFVNTGSGFVGTGALT